MRLNCSLDCEQPQMAVTDSDIGKLLQKIGLIKFKFVNSILSVGFFYLFCYFDDFIHNQSSMLIFSVGKIV